MSRPQILLVIVAFLVGFLISSPGIFFEKSSWFSQVSNPQLCADCPAVAPLNICTISQVPDRGAELSGASGIRKKFVKSRLLPNSSVNFSYLEKTEGKSTPWKSKCKIPLMGVLTTISSPTSAIEILCKHSENNKTRRKSQFPVIIIADRKAPLNWPKHCNGIEYITVEDQIKLASSSSSSSLTKFISQVPWNHFGRKNIGYLLAIERGACSIWDFDDDNVLISTEELSQTIAKANSAFDGEMFGMRIPQQMKNVFTSSSPLINPYTLFSPSRWFYPRGIPLERIHDESMKSGELIRMTEEVRSSIAVIQSAAMISPDVDAVYRLTNPSHRFFFKSYIPLVTLLPPAIAPYNAQATLHLSSALWASFLPMTVHGRVSDIWRSYISQALFHALDLTIAFAPPWVQHDRSPHDLVKDLVAEDEIYQMAESLVSFLSSWSKEVKRSRVGVCVPQLLNDLYLELYQYDIVQEQDLSSVSLWISALIESGMTFPCVKGEKSSLSSFVLSPPRPGRFPKIHTAVHINTDFWKTIGVWHSVFAHQYSSTHFYVMLEENSEERKSPLHQITTHSAWTRNQFSGDLAYQTLLDALQHSPAASRAPLLLWQHDDIFIDPRLMGEMLRREKGYCYASAVENQLDDVSEWNKTDGWMWIQKDIFQLAAQHFIHAKGAWFDGRCKQIERNRSQKFQNGFSDMILLNRSCNRLRVFLEVLQEMSIAGMFLEIAVPTATKCSFLPTEHLLTDALRLDHNHTVYVKGLEEDLTRPLSRALYHPVKMGTIEGAFAQMKMRDMTWSYCASREDKCNFES